jgi:hypothetical protein
MAKAGKRPAAAKGKRVVRLKKPSAARVDRLVKLSVAVGDPLQPGGLSEYLTAIGSGDGARGAGTAASSPKASRNEALKAAQARWSSRQKDQSKRR